MASKKKKYMVELDKIDKEIINLLQEDGKMTIKQLASSVNLSITPTYERLKKIESTGIINKYVALVNPKMVEKNLIVYCQVTLIKHQEKYFERFEAYTKTIDEIIEVSYIAGNYDILLKVILKDMSEYQVFVMNKLSNLDIVSNIQSSFIIKQFKNETKITLK